ncbi:choice-of-anchor D domain-containing protein [Hamadaea tsunoensis]|uniref:choice-of-anchor D domain-containing protein n=1 Tax=Hamadaea tsunoensis TaxID=53368 RepID=UPI001B7F7E82|nr:choice-of-anchor D domain-containing protein [Hamadaea tsunoensis]
MTGIALEVLARCSTDPAEPPVKIGVRWHSTLDYAAVSWATNGADFGDQPQNNTGTPTTLTYTAHGSIASVMGAMAVTGASPSSFLLSDDTCSQATLTYGQSCSVKVTPHPVGIGLQKATLTIPDNSVAGHHTIYLSLNGVDDRAVVVTPDQLRFNLSEVGLNSAPQPVTVKVTGPASVTFGTASIDGTDANSFLIAADTCSGTTASTNGTCSLQVVANPKRTGPVAATLVVPDNSVAGSHLVYLTAEGVMEQGGTYFPVQPQRLLDTRSGLGAPKAPVKAGGVIHLQVSNGSPSIGVSAVVLNVTVTGPTTSGFVTVYPTGKPRPTTSSLNFPKGWTGANSVTVAVGTGGKIDLYNNSGSTHLIVDIVGSYAANANGNEIRVGGEYQPFQPKRLIDTRQGGSGKLPAGYAAHIPVNFGADVNPHVRAYAVNVTVVNPAKAGFLTTWDGINDLPKASTLNYATNATVSNFAIVPTHPCSVCTGSGHNLPSIGVYTSSTTHVIVDIFGFYDDSTLGDGLRFKPMTPVRIADSRIGQGTPHALTSGATATITTPGSIADSQTYALALNVTAITPTKNTYLAVWPDGIAEFGKPGVSNVNANAGTVVPNAVATLIGPGAAFNVYNQTGTTDICVDVVGSFYYYPYAKPYPDPFQRDQSTNSFVPASHVPTLEQPGPVIGPAA